MSGQERRPVASRRGIPHWKEKLLIIRKVLGAYTDTEIPDLVVPNNSADPNLSDNIRKWHKHKPGYRQSTKVFFDYLPSALGCAEQVTGKMLVDSSLEEFVAYLPEETQRLVALRVSSPSSIARSDQVLSTVSVPPVEPEARTFRNFMELVVHDQVVIEPIQLGINGGYVNQKHYYLTPDAAENWNNLVRAEAYPTYDQCKAGLRSLVRDPAWLSAIAEGRHSTVVMLAGGGAPSKDMVLIQSLLTQGSGNDRRIEYYIVDISIYMLYASMFFLRDTLRAMRGGERVKVVPVLADVLAIRDTRDLLSGRGTVFAITGGTIGNMSERSFFSSVGRMAASGDLLIVSADTIDGNDPAGTSTRLLEKYDHPDMRTFIEPVVRTVKGQMDIAHPLRHVFDTMVRVEVRDGQGDRLSDVPGSKSVTVSLESDSTLVGLVSSTRYFPENFCDFAAEFGWESLAVVRSPLNGHFVQMLFRKR